MRQEVNTIRSILMLQLPLLQKKYPIAKMALLGSVVRYDYDPGEGNQSVDAE